MYKTKVKILDGHEQKIMKTDNPNSCKTKVLSPHQTPMKMKNYKKQPVIIFAPYNFLIFLDTQLHEPKTSEKNISEYFSNGVLVLFRRKFTCSQEFGMQKIGGGYYKLRFNGSEGFNTIFGVGISENLLAAKIEGNCI